MNTMKLYDEYDEITMNTMKLRWNYDEYDEITMNTMKLYDEYDEYDEIIRWIYDGFHVECTRF